MKTNIHPAYMPTRITCACGRVTETFATIEELHVEICSHCHPFFTGRQKLVDTAGRVERFRRKYSAGEEMASAAVSAGRKTEAAQEDAAAGSDEADREESPAEGE